MAETTEWGEDFSGVSPLAGPAGDPGRQKSDVRNSLVLAAVALVLCLVLAGLLANVHFQPDASFGLSGPVILLLLMAWAAAGYGWVLAFLSKKPADGSGGTRRTALWMNALLVLVLLALTTVVAVYVILPLVVLALLFGFIQVKS